MAKMKVDGIVEAVHYNSDGNIQWVRAYLRRGQTFSDIVLLDRQTLAEKLKSGKRFVAGKRVLLQASTFEVSQPIRLIQQERQDILTTGDAASNKDHLAGVPVI